MRLRRIDDGPHPPSAAARGERANLLARVLRRQLVLHHRGVNLGALMLQDDPIAPFKRQPLRANLNPQAPPLGGRVARLRAQHHRGAERLNRRRLKRHRLAARRCRRRIVVAGVPSRGAREKQFQIVRLQFVSLAVGIRLPYLDAIGEAGHLRSEVDPKRPGALNVNRRSRRRGVGVHLRTRLAEEAQLARRHLHSDVVFDGQLFELAVDPSHPQAAGAFRFHEADFQLPPKALVRPQPHVDGAQRVNAVFVDVELLRRQQQIVLRPRLAHIAANGDGALERPVLDLPEAEAAAIGLHLQDGALGRFENDRIARRRSGRLPRRGEKDHRTLRDDHLPVGRFHFIVEDDERLAVVERLRRLREAPMLRRKIRGEHVAIAVKRLIASDDFLRLNPARRLLDAPRRLDERRQRQHIRLIQRRRHGESNRSMRKACKHESGIRNQESGVRSPGTGVRGQESAIGFERTGASPPPAISAHIPLNHLVPPPGVLQNQLHHLANRSLAAGDARHIIRRAANLLGGVAHGDPQPRVPNRRHVGQVVADVRNLFRRHAERRSDLLHLRQLVLHALAHEIEIKLRRTQLHDLRTPPGDDPRLPARLLPQPNRQPVANVETLRLDPGVVENHAPIRQHAVDVGQQQANGGATLSEFHRKNGGRGRAEGGR